MKIVDTELQGIDKYGHFQVEANACGFCGKLGIVVNYYDYELPSDLPEIPNLIIERAEGVLGIQCGHYAGANRQIVHLSYKLNLKKVN